MDDLEILEMFRNKSEEAIKQCEKKYAGLTIDNTTLEEIMLYYVRREKKEWK